MTTCSRCVMDKTAGNITFDGDGVCNYCTNFFLKEISCRQQTGNRQQALDEFVEQVKREGRGKKYDCVIGVSGGIDSSYALYKASELGLRPLAVHMDNGWNSELAQHNIERLLEYCGCDLFTYVIEWDEYRSLMQSFFDADVIDLELLYDNAMLSVVYGQARRYGLRYILSGCNNSTEGIAMPPDWNWYKFDQANIFSIYNKKGAGSPIKSYPSIGTNEYLWHRLVRRTSWVDFLDFFDYRKDEAMNLLKDAVGFIPYPGKHFESVFTRFYQGYILPNKFNVDKRRLHLSNLVITGQIQRIEALKSLKAPPYSSEDSLKRDKSYVLKKIGWTEKDLDEYIKRPQQPHTKYDSELQYWKRIVDTGKLMKSFVGRFRARS